VHWQDQTARREVWLNLLSEVTSAICEKCCAWAETIWSGENPNATHLGPLHSEKVGVWCAVSPRRIIGPIFSMKPWTLTATLMIYWISWLLKKEHGYFQQDNAAAHTANATMVAIREVLEDRIICRGLWPSQSPDLSFCHFYLWGNLKGKFYKNNPHSIEALQAEITHIIGSIVMDELQRVSHNLFMRCEACSQAEGGHFQHLLRSTVRLCYLLTVFL
jgi:hypothetical protein